VADVIAGIIDAGLAYECVCAGFISFCVERAPGTFALDTAAMFL